MTSAAKASSNKFTIVSQRGFSVSPVTRYPKPPGPIPSILRTMLQLLELSMSSMCGEKSSRSNSSQSSSKYLESNRSSRTDTRSSGWDVFSPSSFVLSDHVEYPTCIFCFFVVLWVHYPRRYVCIQQPVESVWVCVIVIESRQNDPNQFPSSEESVHLRRNVF